MIAGRGEPAAHEHDLAAGQALDLVQHVGADDHRATLLAQALEELVPHASGQGWRPGRVTANR